MPGFSCSVPSHSLCAYPDVQENFLVMFKLKVMVGGDGRSKARETETEFSSKSFYLKFS